MREETAVAKVSVCIEMLFTEVDFCQRPAKVAEVGLKAVEFWGAEGKDIGRLKDACEQAGVAVAAMLGPAPFALIKEHSARTLVREMRDVARIAHELRVPTLIATVGNRRARVPARRQTDTIVRNLKAIAPVAQDEGLRLALEPLNTLVDHKGYFLQYSEDARRIVERVGSPAVGLLYDVYHMQIMEGNLIETIRRMADVIYHVHVADVPGRHEPGTGEINYANVLQALEATGYAGYCGFEFKPTSDSAASVQRALRACRLV